MGEKEKIKQFLDYKGVSKNKFYTLTGFSVGFLDSGTSMGADKVKIIINTFPELNINWLIMDEGEMIIDKKSISFDNILKDELIKAKDEIISLQSKHISLLEEKLKMLQK
ncbi:MAG: hypothetical protein PHD21_00035 [Flavobacteriales bacterium]|nr:hypothetical protein [Flavobacteriales bacterium]